jgi:hypothetical protein
MVILERFLKEERTMMEAVGIPILFKAVDFLFEEGSKILRERRERREAKEETHKAQPATDALLPSSHEAKVANVKSVQSKEAALNQQITESACSASETEIKHLMTLLEIYTLNYYRAKEKYAMWGSALVPTIIVHELTEAENAVASTMKNLQTALSKVYGKEVIASEVERDEHSP